MALPEENGLQVWCFVSGADQWAITQQKDGGNLPEACAPWRFLKSVHLNGTDPEERAAEGAVREFGFCCFRPPAPDEAAPASAVDGR